MTMQRRYLLLPKNHPALIFHLFRNLTNFSWILRCLLRAPLLADYRMQPASAGSKEASAKSGHTRPRKE